MKWQKFQENLNTAASFYRQLRTTGHRVRHKIEIKFVSVAQSYAISMQRVSKQIRIHSSWNTWKGCWGLKFLLHQLIRIHSLTQSFTSGPLTYCYVPGNFLNSVDTEWGAISGPYLPGPVVQSNRLNSWISVFSILSYFIFNKVYLYYSAPLENWI